MILGIQGIGEYVTGLAKALHSRGFELPANPAIEFDDAGFLDLSIAGLHPRTWFRRDDGGQPR